MRINELTTQQVFRRLVTSENGLSAEEALRRLQEFGPNQITEVRRSSLLRVLSRQFVHFLAIILWVAATLAFLSEYLHPGEGMLALALAIIAVIVINGIFTFIQEYRAEKSIEKLSLLLPFQVNVIREGKRREVPARAAVPGDLILLAEGDRVPADARLVETSFLMVNNAALTGESEPVSVHPNPEAGELIDSRNIVFAGTTVMSGSGRAVVFATGMATEVGRVAHLTSTVEPGLTPLQKEIAHATRVVAFLATTTGIVFFVIGQLIGRPFWESFLFAIGIIVANVPEGLLPTVTLSLAMGSQRMARKKALIKTLPSVEALGSVTVICTDKTGTLTQNRMEVKMVWADGKLQTFQNARGESAPMMWTIASLCNNASYSEGRYKGDPSEVALRQAAGLRIGDVPSRRIREFPFDSERKRMTTIQVLQGRTLALTKGAPETLLPLCRGWLNNGQSAPLDESSRQELTASCHQMMDLGLRVLSFAYRDVSDRELVANSPECIERDMTFVGLIGLQDPPRPEVAQALGKCHEAGIKVIMITGDAGRTAVAIGKETGLVRTSPTVVEGHELSGLSDPELREKLCEKEIIFARMTPKHKLRVVTALQEEGERVAVTGDGVNDAPALKKADIGVAMGIAGTDVAKEAADMILLDDNFATIVNAIEEGRGVYENIRKFTSYIFSSNIPEIVPYLAFVLLRIPLPLTILQILAVDLGTDMLPALALGAEKPTGNLMKQPPRDPKRSLLSAGLLRRAYLFLGPMEAAAGLFGFFYVLNSGGWRWGELLPPDDPLYLQATTACLTAIVVTQIANVFACRSFRESVFRLGFFSNPLIFFGILIELGFQLFIVYHPLGNRMFGTASLPATVWLVLIPFAVFLFVAEEIRKAIVRSRWPVEDFEHPT